MATCGEVLVKLLEDYGVEQVFGIPGVHTVELYRGLARSSINHVTPRHEQGAGFMADGYARTSGKPGVCFIITGPGMTNITTAMGQAYADSIPMLVISSVQSRSQLGGGRGKLHELPNQGALVAGVAAFSHTLMSAAELPAVLARAFALFQAGRPRPVHIEIPLDVLVEDADALLSSQPVSIARAGAAPSAVARMSELLANAKRPLILAGGGAIDAAAELTELAELLDAPVALTINAKGLLPSTHPLLIGSTQSLVATRELVADADVVLAIGTELAETDYDVTFAGGFEIPGKLLRIDIDADQTVRNYPPHVALVADSRNAAFRRLFNYIAGRNVAQQKIEMTVPVVMNPPGQGEKIEMTAPVVSQGETMQFVLPARFTLDTAPRPADAAVRLRAIEAQWLAVRRYSGTWSERNFAQNEAALRRAIAMSWA